MTHLHPNYAQKMKERDKKDLMFDAPFHQFNKDENMKDKQKIKETFKQGMLLYNGLISKKPNEQGIYDNFTNNIKIQRVIIITSVYQQRFRGTYQ